LDERARGISLSGACFDGAQRQEQTDRADDSFGGRQVAWIPSQRLRKTISNDLKTYFAKIGD
jgi:hypothetical protein